MKERLVVSDDLIAALQDARRGLEEMAGRGRSYRYDEVFFDEEQDSEVYGAGFDLARGVQVTLDGDTVVAGVELRLLKSVKNEIIVRLWLTWDSPFGSHRSYALYSLTDRFFNILALSSDHTIHAGEDESAEGDGWVLEEVTPDFTLGFPGDASDESEAAARMMEGEDHALADLSQRDYGLLWEQLPPNLSWEAMAYHERFVSAVRQVDPAWLGLLSPFNYHEVSARMIIDLHRRLQQPDLQPA